MLDRDTGRPKINCDSDLNVCDIVKIVIVRNNTKTKEYIFLQIVKADCRLGISWYLMLIVHNVFQKLLL